MGEAPPAEFIHHSEPLDCLCSDDCCSRESWDPSSHTRTAGTPVPAFAGTTLSDCRGYASVMRASYPGGDTMGALAIVDRAGSRRLDEDQQCAARRGRDRARVRLGRGGAQADECESMTKSVQVLIEKTEDRPMGSLARSAIKT